MEVITLMKKRKSIYEPIFEYIETAIQNGINNNIERHCIAGLIASLIAIIILLLFPNSSNSELIILEITWVVIYTRLYFFMKPKKKG